MNVRDEYPYLRASVQGFNGERLTTEINRALDEIDRLRAEADEYAAIFGEVAKVYDHITGGLISKPETDSSHVIAEADNQVMRRVDEAITEDRGLIDYRDDEAVAP